MPVRTEHFVKGNLPLRPSSFHISLRSTAPVPCITADGFVSWNIRRFTGLTEVIGTDCGSLWAEKSAGKDAESIDGIPTVNNDHMGVVFLLLYLSLVILSELLQCG